VLDKTLKKIRSLFVKKIELNVDLTLKRKLVKHSALKEEEEKVNVKLWEVD